MNIYYKSTENTFKDFDEKKGIVSGYASVFGNVDSDGDIIKSGAYSKTIKENGDRIAFLWQHQIDKPIGKTLKLEEDSYGLRAEAKLADTRLGKDAAILIQEGIIKEFSVGFQNIKGQIKGDHYEIQETKLFEFSLVTLAANPKAVITGMKSEQERNTLLAKRIEALENYMRKGSVSDETFRLIEFEIQNIKNTLTLEIQEPRKRTQELEPSFDFQKFNNILKNN